MDPTVEYLGGKARSLESISIEWISSSQLLTIFIFLYLSLQPYSNLPLHSPGGIILHFIMFDERADHGVMPSTSTLSDKEMKG